MADFNQLRSDYMKAMFGERKKNASLYNPDNVNNLGGTSFDTASLSDVDLDSAIKMMQGSQYENSDVFKAFQTEKQKRQDEQEPKKEKSWIEQVGDFFSNIGTSIMEGVFNVADDLWDFTIGTTAGLFGGGWFGAKNDFVDWAADAMSDDRWIDYATHAVSKLDQFAIFDKGFWTNEGGYWSDWSYENVKKQQEEDYEGMGWVRQGGNLVGEMIPSIALAIATGGSNLGVQAAAQGGMAFAEGMGRAQSTALSEGATFQGSAGYGALKGAISGGIRTAMIGIGGSALGKGGGIGSKVGDFFGNIAKKTGSKSAEIFATKAGEALTHAGFAAANGFSQALADPLVKQITYDADAIAEAYGDNEKVMQTLTRAGYAALTSAAMSLATSAIREGGARLIKGKERYEANFDMQKAIRYQKNLESELKKLNSDIQNGKEVNIRERIAEIDRLTSEVEKYGSSALKSFDAFKQTERFENVKGSKGYEAEVKSFVNLMQRKQLTDLFVRNIGIGNARLSYNAYGDGKATIGNVAIIYPANSKSAFYSDVKNPNLPAIEATVIDNKPVLTPTNAEQMGTLAALASDPAILKSLPDEIMLPLRDKSVPLLIKDLTETDQLMKLANLKGSDFKKQENGSFLAELGGGKALSISENGTKVEVIDTNKINTPTETTSVEKTQELSTDVDKKQYDFSEPRELDRFLGDTASSLIEGFNNQDEHWEIQEDKPLTQRLKDLDLAANADRATAKKYLVDYYKNLEVTYTNNDLDGKKYTYKLTELLTPEERKEFSDEVGKAFDELLAKGDVSKNEKILQSLNSTIAKYRDRLKTVIAERKEANAKAENTRLLGNQIHRLREDYPLRDSSNEINPVATRGNARWAFVHHIHGKGGSYSLDDNFFKSIDDYTSMVEKSDIKESGYYLQEVRSAALLNELASMLSGVNEVDADGKTTHHSLTSAQERLVLDTIKEIKKIVKVERKLDTESKTNAYSVKDNLAQIVDQRGKVGAAIFKGLSHYGANFLKPDTAFKLMFGSSNAINDILGKKLNQGFNKAMLEYEKNYNELLEAKFKELKLDKKYFKGMLKFRGKDVPSEVLMTIYAVSKSKDVVFDREGNPSLVDGNNLVSLREKGISYEHKKTKHDIYWDDNLLEDVEKTLPDNYKKMVDWAVDFGNTTGRSEYERMSLARTQGADTTNTIQGVYVPKKSDIGRSGFGSAVVSGIRDLSYMKTRTGSVNQLSSFDVVGEYGKQYLNTLLTEYIMPVVSEINGVFSAVIDENGHTLLQLLERDQNLSKWVSKAIDNKIKAVLGITDERFKDNTVMRIYNALLKNVGSLALVGKVGPLLKQPVSDFAIPGFSNVEMIALAPQEIAILSDRAKMKAINEHNANTFYGARIRNKKNAYAAAMLNAEDGLNIVHEIGFKPFSWMDKGAIAFGNAYIAAHLQNSRPDLVFGSDEYWAASDEMTAKLYDYSVNHIATNMPIVMNSNNPIVKTVSLFQVPNMLLASGIGDAIADTETYFRLPSLDKLKELKETSEETSKIAKTAAEEAEKKLDDLQKQDEETDYSSMSKEEADKVAKDFKKKISEAAEDYKKKSDDYTKAKGKAEQDKKNYDFKSKFKPGKALSHAVSTIIMVSALMVAISELDRHIRGKKDWDDWSAEDLGKSFVEQAVSGWIPGVNTLTSTFIKGYDVSASGFDVLNDIKDDVQSVVKAWNNGKFDRTMIMPMVDMISRLFGIPVKNAYELVYGTIKTFDPKTAAEMKDFFYGTSKQSLAKLIKTYEAKNDFSTSSKLLQRSYVLYKTGEIEHDVAVELSKLEAQGLNPIARNIPDYIQNEEGERVVLTDDQRIDFSKVYSESNKQVAKLIKSARYRNYEPETKAKEIKKVYDLYYEVARYKSMGIDPQSRLGRLLAYASGYDDDILMTLMLIQQNSELADTKRLTKKEQAIKLVNQQPMSKKQRLLTLYLMGYGVSEENKKLVKDYLISLGFTKKQAEDFLPSK